MSGPYSRLQGKEDVLRGIRIIPLTIIAILHLPHSALTKLNYFLFKLKWWCVEHPVTQALQLWQLKRQFFAFLSNNFWSLMLEMSHLACVSLQGLLLDPLCALPF